VIQLHAKLGPYYYGFADHFFAKAVIKKYPVQDKFWKQFDVIHCNQTMGLPLLQLQKTGIPMVYMVHHPVTADREISVAESHGFTALNWKLKYWLLVHNQRYLCRKLPNLATVSHTVAKRLVADYGCEEAKITVIPNGIDLEVFCPDTQEEPEFDVVALGSFIHPRKGFPYLVEVYKALAGKGLRIADVGRRSDEQRSLLKNVAGIAVMGTVPEETLLRVLQKSKVLVSTSLYEGFGLSMIEALACGRPAFVFDAGATGEVLHDIDPSLLSPIRNVDHLVQNICLFLRLSQTEQQRRGEEYRRAVREHYSLQHSAACLRRFYASLLEKNRA
jgi:glycosyltransferase involved in cell wall biosynthesis